jgi:tryptophan halogenase
MLAGETKTAERALRDNLVHTERLCARLPRHRELLRKVVEHGLQPV